MALGPSSNLWMERFLSVLISSAVILCMLPFELEKRGLESAREATCLDIMDSGSNRPTARDGNCSLIADCTMQMTCFKYLAIAVTCLRASSVSGRLPPSALRMRLIPCGQSDGLAYDNACWIRKGNMRPQKVMLPVGLLR